MPHTTRLYIIIPVDTDEDPSELLDAAQEGSLYWPEQIAQDECIVQCLDPAAVEVALRDVLDARAALLSTLMPGFTDRTGEARSRYNRAILDARRILDNQ